MSEHTFSFEVFDLFPKTQLSLPARKNPKLNIFIAYSLDTESYFQNPMSCTYSYFPSLLSFPNSL